MSSKTTTISDWLVDAAQLQPGEHLTIHLGYEDTGVPPPSYQDMRAALYAQYGADTLIRIYKHGPRITIFIHADEESRSRFDYRSKASVMRDSKGVRTEIENGFERKLS